MGDSPVGYLEIAVFKLRLKDRKIVKSFILRSSEFITTSSVLQFCKKRVEDNSVVSSEDKDFIWVCYDFFSDYIFVGQQKTSYSFSKEYGLTLRELVINKVPYELN